MQFSKGSVAPEGRKVSSLVQARLNPFVPSSCCAPSPCELFLERGGHRMQAELGLRITAGSGPGIMGAIALKGGLGG